MTNKIEVTANGRIFIDGKVRDDIIVALDSTNGKRHLKRVSGNSSTVIAEVKGRTWNDPAALNALIGEHA